MANSTENMSISSLEQPDDSGAESWSLLSASINNRELQCSICINMMEKPHLVQCGHSFCFVCISQWLNNSSDCPVCRKMIYKPMRNIALENVIEEYRNVHGQNKISRNESLRKGILKSCQRIPSDDVIPLNVALTPSVEPSRTSKELGNRRRISVNKAVRIHRLRDATYSSSEGECSLASITEKVVSTSVFGQPKSLVREQDSEASLRPQQFERFSAGRRTEFLPRRRRSSKFIGDGDSKTPASSDIPSSPFQVIFYCCENYFVFTAILTVSTQYWINTAIADSKVVHEVKESTHSNGVFSKMRLPAMIKKLVPFRMSFKPSKKLNKSDRAHCEKDIKDIPELTDDLARLNMRLCVYSGAGNTFTRMYAGNEITVVVMGKKGVGKTTFVDNIAISIANNTGTAYMIGQRERRSWSVDSLQPSGDVAHLISVVLPMQQNAVLDFIDTDDGKEDSLDALIRAADVIVVIYSASDSSSMLRLMAAVRHAERIQNPPAIVVIGNVFDGSRVKVVRENMAKAVTQNLNSSNTLFYETDLNQPSNEVIKILHDMSIDVFARRNVDSSALNEAFVL